MRRHLRKAAIALLCAAQFGATNAFADASGDMMSMMESMKRQMSEMQRTIDDQNKRIQQLESRSVLETPQPSASMQPAGTPPSLSEKDWQGGISENIGKAVPWMKGLKFGGDFRLRHEFFDFYDKNNDAGSTGTANDRSRQRFRIRLRYGFEKDYGDDWKIGFRMATGTTTDQTSTNQTLGNAGYFTYKTVVIDRAFAQYTPNGLKDYGPMKGVTIGAGKFDNPFLRYSTAIVWDGDVTPEGMFEKANVNLVSTEDNKLNFYGTLGQFITNENAGTETDAEVYGYQGALTWSTYALGTEKPVDFTAALTYYDYPNWFQTVTNNTAATSYLRTNTSALDDPQILDFYPEIAFSWGSTPVVLWGDFVNNVGTIDPDRAALSDVHDDDFAWGLGFKVGAAKKKGGWDVFYGYYSIGANAVVAAFNDSDFGGPGYNGFTNRLGHKFGLDYKITDNLTFSWTNYFVSPLHPVTSSIDAFSTNESVYRSQADLVYAF